MSGPPSQGHPPRSEEIAHAVTHGLGLALSLAGLAALVVTAASRSQEGDVWHLVAAAVFGTSLVLLYAASTLYHALPPGRAKAVFRRLDHAAIYVLIAGTYTPFALVSLRGPWGYSLLAVAWGLATLGVVLEATIPHRTRRLSVLLYLGMGWLALVALGPLRAAVSPEGLALLFLGGAAYTLGVIFYAWKRVPWNHAIWHVFVMAGSALHFACVLAHVMPATS